MYSAEKHLSPEQVDWLINGKGSDAACAAPVEFWEEAHQHLAHCTACEKLVELHGEIEKRLVGLKGRPGQPPSEECLDEKLCWQVAAGTLPEVEAEKLMNHAIQCVHCSPLLKAATEDFAQDASPQETGQIDALNTANRDWQRSMARQLAGSFRHRIDKPTTHSIRARVRWFTWPRVAASAMAVTVIGALALWTLRPSPQETGERLLADAYTQRRTLELRIPGASFAPLRQSRGAEASQSNRPLPLIDAESLIARNLAQAPGAPTWLDDSGRADLLEGNYSAAMESFQRAVQLRPESAIFLTDLASAFFERAEVESRPQDFSHAFEDLSKAIQAQPNDPVALFNRAIVGERLALYESAISDWELYLSLDPNGSWAGEARRRLAALKEKIKQRQISSAAPLLSPREFAEVAKRGDPASDEHLNQRFEDYLSVAARDWLRLAFPRTQAEVSEIQSEAARRALSELGRIGKAEHRDAWLSDLLDGEVENSQFFADGAESLSNSISDIDKGDYVASGKDAARAIASFSHGNSPAGVSYARVQEVYSLQLSHRPEECSRLAETLESSLHNRSYQWLATQIMLERAICTGILGKIDDSRTYANRAVDSASASNYAFLYLRGVGLVSSLDATTGKSDAAWSASLAGLEKFWESLATSMRGYSLYINLDSLAEKAHQWHLQAAVLQEAIATLGPSQNVTLLAMVHTRLGNAARLAQMPVLARTELEKGGRLFQMVPQTDATHSDRIEAATWLADLEEFQGQYDEALKGLQNLQVGMAHISSVYIAIRYFEAKGTAQAHVGNLNEAERSFRSAIALSEQTLVSQHTERDRITWSREAGPAYRSIVELEFRKGNAQAALEIWEWFRGASLRATTAPSPVAQLPTEYSALENAPALPNLQEVALQAKNFTHETYVSYASFPDGELVWVFDDRGITSKWLDANPATLQQVSSRFSSMCADPNSDFSSIQADARMLYNVLVAPIADRFSPGRTVVIEAEGTLAQVQFQALLDDRGQYLLDRFDLTVSPGVYFVTRARPGAPISSNSSALVIGAPSLPTGELKSFAPLPDAKLEAENIARRFRTEKLLTGSQATLRTIEALLPEYEVFHFAGHALLSSDGVRLVLAEDSNKADTASYLGAKSLVALRLPKTQLAVFSACETEQSESGDLADPGSLVRAFLRSGVPHIVASRWRVDSTVTTALMEKLYDGLLAGQAPVHALRLASLGIRGEQGHRHPFFWAAFDAVGRT